MKQNYFVYNGRKYNAGEIITVRQFDCILRRLCETSAIFINYDTEQNEYHLKINDRIVSYSEKDFNRIFCGDVENNTNNSTAMTENKKHTFMDELNIDDLFFAWIWYIVIMAIAVIFYSRIVIWIIASLVFFNYRNKKLKEVGYK